MRQSNNKDVDSKIQYINMTQLTFLPNGKPFSKTWKLNPLRVVFGRDIRICADMQSLLRPQSEDHLSMLPFTHS